MQLLRWLFPVGIWALVIFLAAQQSLDGRVVQMDSTLALHSEASSDNPPVDFLPGGTLLYVVGRSADGRWLEVRSGSTLHGWVIADFVDMDLSLMAIPITDGTAPGQYFSPDVATHIREIYAQGQERGNRPDVFARVGDSISVSRNFLDSIGYGRYNIDAYTHLAPVIDYYSKQTFDGVNSFNRKSLATKVGWAAWGVLSPDQANRAYCGLQESPLTCEYRKIRPSIALIMFGTNDMGYRTTAQYRADLQAIIHITIDRGIIPVLSTIPPRPGLETDVAQFNAVVIELASENVIPLWDYGQLMSQLPAYGLIEDGIHPSVPPDGSGFTAIFTEQNLQYGYVVRNLSALEMLYRVWMTLQQSEIE